MHIQQKTGNINFLDTANRSIDWLELEWFESNKRILRKKTNSGTEIIFRSLDADPQLTQGDVLYEDEHKIIAIEIMDCEAIVVKPVSMYEMASVCYEIGNKHLPLFYDNDELLVPFELPLFRLLSSLGYTIKQEQRKLLQRLKTTVAGHAHTNNETLFSKIMKMTTNG
jgi:urease accessory protein